MKKNVAIIGAHGLYANYGGWDQLIKNLAENKNDSNIEYLIFNSRESAKVVQCPPGVKVRHLPIKASGFEGIFYDFWSILICYFKMDSLLLLGVQGIPLIYFLRIFKKVNVISNPGGIEWRRPKFGLLPKLYLKFCFNLAFRLSGAVILDNEYYRTFTPKFNFSREKIHIIPYGGTIDETLDITKDLSDKYPFLTKPYFLSISRSLKDNMVEELCASFANSQQMLVLISNLSNSDYGRGILAKYSKFKNIILIDGLYSKPVLDLIRRKAKAYIHTHTLCGTAPSLVEMIVAKRPIISIDIPQNRHTLSNKGFFFKEFSELIDYIETHENFDDLVPEENLALKYDWKKIVRLYESLY